MSRNKNAKRQHEVADWATGQTEPPTTWLALAKFIPTITDASSDVTEAFADYAGDGTETDYLVSRPEVWDVEGHWDPTDAAQALITSKKRAQNDDERKVWHRITENDGTVVVGIAKALNIVAGSGDASAYEEFKCSLHFVNTPDINPGA